MIYSKDIIQMPKISKSWSDDAYNCFVETLYTDCDYIYLANGKQVARTKDFTLEYYTRNKTFTITENKTSHIAGILYAYNFDFSEVLNLSSRGIMIDNPVIFKEYRGKGLSLWAYKKIQRFYDLPIVSCTSHTKDVLNSVWGNFHKTGIIYAKNKVTKELIFNWSTEYLNTTHGEDGKDWYLIYQGEYKYGRKTWSGER